MARKHSKEELKNMSQKELSKAIGEALIDTGKSIFGGIKGMIDSRREAKEEAERREKERLERQRKSELRTKIIKKTFMVILILAVLGGVFILINRFIWQNRASFFSDIFEAIKGFFTMAGAFFVGVFSRIVDFIKTIWPFGKE
jgi:putative exporter of polyketide antibiotics